MERYKTSVKKVAVVVERGTFCIFNNSLQSKIYKFLGVYVTLGLSSPIKIMLDLATGNWTKGPKFSCDLKT